LIYSLISEPSTPSRTMHLTEVLQLQSMYICFTSFSDHKYKFMLVYSKSSF
jgi:hypothetical protein